jgi:hypothetical protein|tara:strand:- start:89 stop:247 length:159 start_codon:yes stop_codon:yes gene_type:complete
MFWRVKVGMAQREKARPEGPAIVVQRVREKKRYQSYVMLLTLDHTKIKVVIT